MGHFWKTDLLLEFHRRLLLSYFLFFCNNVAAILGLFPFQAATLQSLEIVPGGGGKGGVNTYARHSV